jgi:anti-sigma B factor antagonist
MASVSNPAPNVVALGGEIDLHQSQHVKDGINPLIENKTQRVLIDLSGVSYIDSSGIAVLIDALQRVQAYGGKLALCGLRETVKNIFEIARLDQVFKIYADREAAEAAL